jgi:hypothetical protein
LEVRERELPGFGQAFQQRPGAAMNQPIRSRRKDLPPDQRGPQPDTSPDPVPPDLDSDVNDIRLPGGDAPAPDLEPPRERVSATARPVATAPDPKSRQQP